MPLHENRKQGNLLEPWAKSCQGNCRGILFAGLALVAIALLEGLFVRAELDVAH
jgi:hypothetical protein